MVEGDSKRLVKQHATYISEHDTNNVAEYTGAIIGLETAVELVTECGQPIPVRILGDSKLVTKQLKGQWEVRSQNLLPTLSACRSAC